MKGKAYLTYRDGSTKLVDLSGKRSEGMLDNLKQIVFYSPEGKIARALIPAGETGVIFQRTTLALDSAIGWMLSPSVSYAIGYDGHLIWIDDDDD